MNEGIRNYGISFGQNIPGLIVVSLMVLGVLVYLAIRERKLSLWIMVLGGALNVLERVYWGYVRDYWKIPFTPLYNNANDWLIFGGGVWYLIQKWRQTKSK